ncbi:MAG: hypothetical protein ACFFCO_10575 [Promethearchaeota archaeon]
MRRTKIFIRWLLLGVLLLLILSLLLTSCYRIVRPEGNPTSASANPNPTPITGILVARGGAVAEWSTTMVKPHFEPNSAKLQIPPGGPPLVPYAYVAIDSPVATVNEIEKIEAQYFIPTHVTSDFTPYVVIGLDLDGDGSGCDDFIIGGESGAMPKNQWNSISPSKWIIVSEGGTEYTLEEIRGRLGNQSVIRIRVSVGMWDTVEGLVAYIDGLMVNNTTYNIEPDVSSE